MTPLPPADNDDVNTSMPGEPARPALSSLPTGPAASPDSAGSIADRRTDGPDKAPCRSCSHPRDAHEHHRRGSDCSLSGCGCVHWRRTLPGLLSLLRR